MKMFVGMMVCLVFAGFVAMAADYTPVSKETTGGAVGAAQVTLASGKIIIGQSTGLGGAMTPSGDATVSTGGVVTVSAGAIDNAKVASNAAIARTKLSLGGFTGSFTYLKIDSTTGTVMCADGVITNSP